MKIDKIKRTVTFTDIDGVIHEKPIPFASGFLTITDMNGVLYEKLEIKPGVGDLVGKLMKKVGPEYPELTITNWEPSKD